MPWRDFRSLFCCGNFRGVFRSQGAQDWISQLYSPLITFRNHQSEMEGQGTTTTHTIRSHGVRLARTHAYDWLILLVLCAISGSLNLIDPFHGFVGKDVMSELRYPLKSSTIPFWTVPMYAVLLPIIVFLLFYRRRRDVYDLHNAILGLFFSALITGVITDMLKDASGRPRPDFFWRCFPDGIEAYDRLGDAICHGEKRVVREGYKSFPSGHTSWSFAGLWFLSLYLSGKIKAFDRRGHVAKLCLVLLPLAIATLVGIVMINDYWHHWSDVFVGGLIGFVAATLCYLQFFPPPYHVHGWRTYAYLRIMEEMSRNTRECMQQQNHNHHNNADEVGIHPPPTRDSSYMVRDLEVGRR